MGNTKQVNSFLLTQKVSPTEPSIEPELVNSLKLNEGKLGQDFVESSTIKVLKGTVCIEYVY